MTLFQRQWYVGSSLAPSNPTTVALAALNFIEQTRGLNQIANGMSLSLPLHRLFSGLMASELEPENRLDNEGFQHWRQTLAMRT